jgi:hypothetical protein
MLNYPDGTAKILEFPKKQKNFIGSGITVHDS